MIDPQKQPYGLTTCRLSSPPTSATLPSFFLPHVMTTTLDRCASTPYSTRPSSVPAGEASVYKQNDALEFLSTRSISSASPLELSTPAEVLNGHDGDDYFTSSVPPLSTPPTSCNNNMTNHCQGPASSPKDPRQSSLYRADNTSVFRSQASASLPYSSHTPLPSSLSSGDHNIQDGRSINRNTLEPVSRCPRGTHTLESIPSSLLPSSNPPDTICSSESLLLSTQTLDYRSVMINFPKLCPHSDVIITLMDERGLIFCHKYVLAEQSSFSTALNQLQFTYWMDYVLDSDRHIWDAHFQRAVEEAHIFGTCEPTKHDSMVSSTFTFGNRFSAVGDIILPSNQHILECPLYRVELFGQHFRVLTYSVPAESKHLRSEDTKRSVSFSFNSGPDCKPTGCLVAFYHVILRNLDSSSSPSEKDLCAGIYSSISPIPTKSLVNPTDTGLCAPCVSPLSSGIASTGGSGCDLLPFFAPVSNNDPFDKRFLRDSSEDAQPATNYHVSSPSVTYHHHHHCNPHHHHTQTSTLSMQLATISPSLHATMESDHHNDHRSPIRDASNCDHCLNSESDDSALETFQHLHPQSHHHHHCHHSHVRSRHLHHHHHHSDLHSYAHEHTSPCVSSTPTSLSSSPSPIASKSSSLSTFFADVDVGHGRGATCINVTTNSPITSRQLNTSLPSNRFRKCVPSSHINQSARDTSVIPSVEARSSQCSRDIAVQPSISAGNASRRPIVSRANGAKGERGERLVLLQNLLPPEAVKQIRYIWQEICHKNVRRIHPDQSHTVFSSSESRPCAVNTSPATALDTSLREQFARRVRQVVRQYLGPNALVNTNQLASQPPYESSITSPSVTEFPKLDNAIGPQPTQAPICSSVQDVKGLSEYSEVCRPSSTTPSSNLQVNYQRQPDLNPVSQPKVIECPTSQELMISVPNHPQGSSFSPMDARNTLSTPSCRATSTVLLDALNSATHPPAPNMCVTDLQAARRASGSSKCCMLEWLLSEEADLCLLPASFYESRSSNNSTFSPSFASASLDCTSVDSIASTPAIRKSGGAQPSLSYGFIRSGEPSDQLAMRVTSQTLSTSPVTSLISVDASLPAHCSPTTNVVYPTFSTRNYEHSSPGPQPTTSRLSVCAEPLPPPSSKSNSLLVRLLHPSSNPALQNNCTKCHSKSVNHSDPSSPCILPPEMAPRLSAETDQSTHSFVSVRPHNTITCPLSNSSSFEAQSSPTVSITDALSPPTISKTKRRRSGPPTPHVGAVSSVSLSTRTRHVSSQIEFVGSGRSQCTSVLSRSPPITSLTQLLLQDFPPASTNDSSEYDLSGPAYINTSSTSVTVPSVARFSEVSQPYTLSVSTCDSMAHNERLPDLPIRTSIGPATSLWPMSSSFLAPEHYSLTNCSFPTTRSITSSTITSTRTSITSPLSAPTEYHLLKVVSPPMFSGNSSSRAFFSNDDPFVESTASMSVPVPQTLSSAHPTGTSSSLCRLLLDPCLGPQNSAEQCIVSTPVLPASTRPMKKSKSNFLPTMQPSARALKVAGHDIYEFSTESAESQITLRTASTESLPNVVFQNTPSSGPLFSRQAGTATPTDADTSTDNTLEGDMYRSNASSVNESCLSPEAIAEEVEFLYEILRRDEMERNQEAGSCSVDPNANKFSPKSKRSRLEIQTTSLDSASKTGGDNSALKIADSDTNSHVDAQAVARICEQLQEGFTSRQSVLPQNGSLSAYDSFSQVIGPNRLPTSPSVHVGLQSDSLLTASPVVNNQIANSESNTWPCLTQSVTRPLLTSRNLNKGAVAAARAVQQAAASQRRKVTSQRLLIEQRTRLLQHQLYNQVTVYSPNPASTNTPSPEVVISPPLILSPLKVNARPAVQKHLLSPATEVRLSSISRSPPIVPSIRRANYPSSSAECWSRPNVMQSSLPNFTATTVVALSPATLTSSCANSRHYQHHPEELLRFLKEVGPNVQVQLSPAHESSVSDSHGQKSSPFLTRTTKSGYQQIPATTVDCSKGFSQRSQPNVRAICRPSVRPPTSAKVAATLFNPSCMVPTPVASKAEQFQAAIPSIQFRYSQPFVASASVYDTPSQLVDSGTYFKRSTTPRQLENVSSTDASCANLQSLPAPSHWNLSSECDLASQIDDNSHHILHTSGYSVRYVPATVVSVHTPIYDPCGIDSVPNDLPKLLHPVLPSLPHLNTAFVTSLPDGLEPGVVQMPVAPVTTQVHTARSSHPLTISSQLPCSPQATIYIERNRAPQTVSFSPTVIASPDSVGQPRNHFGQCGVKAGSISPQIVPSHGLVLSSPADRMGDRLSCALEVNTKQEDSLLPEDLINDVFDLETMVAAKQRQHQSEHVGSENHRHFFNDEPPPGFSSTVYSDYTADSIEANVCSALTTFPSTGSSSLSPCSPSLGNLLPTDSRSSYLLP